MDEIITPEESPLKRRRGRPRKDATLQAVPQDIPSAPAAAPMMPPQDNIPSAPAPAPLMPSQDNIPSASPAAAPMMPLQSIPQQPLRRAIGFRTGQFAGGGGKGRVSDTMGGMTMLTGLPPMTPTRPNTYRQPRPMADVNNLPPMPMGQQQPPRQPYYGGNQAPAQTPMQQQQPSYRPANNGPMQNGYSGRNAGGNRYGGNRDENPKWRERVSNRRRQDYDYGRMENDSLDDDAFIGSENDYVGRELIDLMELQSLNIQALTRRAQEIGMEYVNGMNRHQLLCEIVRTLCADRNGVLRGGGVLEVVSNGSGFLRSQYSSYLPCQEDVFVSAALIRRWGLRTGDEVIGQARFQPHEKDRCFILEKIDSINGEGPERKREVVPFENLTPYFPTQRILLEHGADDLSARVIDIVTPLGRGQRGLIVAAPRTGKTVIMQKIANSIMINDKDIHLIVLLIDERPEEVTDMRRMVKGEVISSTFDEQPDRHVQVAEMVIERAKRLVEHGRHVVILLDSITRLARAYNTVEPHSGRILTGGVDANALHKPKRFFGAARNIENGGSLTILATALVETGSRMDEVIFEEFKGTGNMELHLDRQLVEKRVYPAINMAKSGTRREELLVHPDELQCIWNLRKMMVNLPQVEAMEKLISVMKKKRSNAEFLLPLANVAESDFEALNN